MSWRLWFWLLISQALWSGSYVAMKFAGAELPIGAVVVLRYGLAALGFMAFLPWMGLPRFERRDLGLIAALGGLNFTLSPSLQVASLRYTQASDVAVLTAFEPLLTLLFAALVLREKLMRRTWAAAFAGVAGVLVLSGVGGLGGGLSRDRLIGNGLYLLALTCEVSVTIAGARLARRYSPLATMGALKTAGFVTAALVYAGVWTDVDFGAVSARAWLSLLYLGWLASLFSYTVWYHVIRQAPVNQAALSLYVQPIVGAALGYFVAHETLGANVWAGGGLIMAGLIWSQYRRRRRVEPPRKLPAAPL